MWQVSLMEVHALNTRLGGACEELLHLVLLALGSVCWTDFVLYYSQLQSGSENRQWAEQSCLVLPDCLVGHQQYLSDLASRTRNP